MTVPVDRDLVKAFVKRLEERNTFIDDANEDKKEIYAEAKGKGVDPKALKQVVSYRRKDREKVEGESEKFTEYLEAVEGPAPAGARARSNIQAAAEPSPEAPQNVVELTRHPDDGLDIPASLDRRAAS